MIIVRARAYVGPNILAPRPLAHITVTIEGEARWPGGAAGSAAAKNLLELLPGLKDHPDAGQAAENFAAMLGQDPRPSLCLVAARVASELQRLHCGRLYMSDAREGTARGQYDIFFDYDDPDIAVLAGRLAVYMVLALLPPELRPANELASGFDNMRARDNFLRHAQSVALDQTTLALIAEAERRDIPWSVLDRSKRIVQLGQGCRLRRLRETVTDRTSVIANWIQRDKTSTVQLFSHVHLPVPRQMLATSPAAAVRAAQSFDRPVVVKPADSKKGMGISINVSGEEAVHAAFRLAQRYSSSTIIETFIPGDDHRVLVVGGKIVAAARRIAAGVSGDGRRSVADLVAEANRDPRRGPGFSKLMNFIQLDSRADALLTRQGLTRDSVPAAGVVVRLSETANISTGGTAVDVTDDIHPANRIMLERAARVAGIDVVGIDFITPDISRSYREVGGAICEINVSPGLRPHQVAAQVPGAVPRDVTGPIIDHLFPDGSNGRIPIASITGTNGKTTTSRMLAHILRSARAGCGAEGVGLVTTSGVTVGEDVVAESDFAGITGARVLLSDPAVETAVLETSRGGIIKSGLGFSWCDVGAVLNIAADHLGLHGVETLDDLANAKQCVVQATRRLAVLNADDPRCLAMASLKPPAQVCLFTLGSLTKVLEAHLDNGGLAITLEDRNGQETLCLHRNGTVTPVIAAVRVPATLEGKARHNIQNAMAALGLALGMGIALPEITDALASFRSDHKDNPGRLNFYSDLPFRIVHDSAHNPHGMRLLCDALKHITVSGRRICVLSGVGTRHGEHIEEMVKIVADQFDFFICSRRERVTQLSEITRDFPLEEVPQRVADALLAEGVDPKSILVIDLDTKAVDRGLEMAREGDLLALLTGLVSWTGERVMDFARKHGVRAKAP